MEVASPDQTNDNIYMMQTVESLPGLSKATQGRYVAAVMRAIAGNEDDIDVECSADELFVLDLIVADAKAGHDDLLPLTTTKLKVNIITNIA